MTGLAKFVCGDYEIPVITDENAPRQAVILTPELLHEVIERMKQQSSQFSLLYGRSAKHESETEQGAPRLQGGAGQNCQTAGHQP